MTTEKIVLEQITVDDGSTFYKVSNGNVVIDDISFNNVGSSLEHDDLYHSTRRIFDVIDKFEMMKYVVDLNNSRANEKGDCE